jgi:WD40 repeat protein
MKRKRLRGVVVTCFCLAIALGSVGHMALGQSEECSPAPPIVWRLAGHTKGGSNFFSLAFSPDGRYLASGSNDRLLKLWDIGTGSEIWSVEIQASEICVVKFDPNGSLLASGDTRGWITLWSTANGEALREFPDCFSACLTSLAFAPDGEAIATPVSGEPSLLPGSEGAIAVLSITTGELEEAFQSPVTHFIAVAYSADGELLAAGGSQGRITLFEASTRRELITLPGSAWVRDLCFSSDGRFLVGPSSHGDFAAVWELTTWPQFHAFRPSCYIRSVALTPDGRSIVTGGFSKDHPEDRLIFWDLQSERRLCNLHCEKNVAAVALSPDGNLLASGFSGGEILIWDVSQLVLGEEPPHASDDIASTLENTAVTINVTMNDSDTNEDLDPSTVTITTPPVSGTTEVDPATGMVTYTPKPDFSGTDTFTYKVSDTHGACDEAACTVDVAAAAPECETSAFFPDENLARVIRNALGKRPEEATYEADLESLTELVAIAEGIVDLSGLNYAVNLTQLDLYGNEITDISVLAELPNLIRIDLEGNPLDMSPGSEAMEVIQTLLDRGVAVDY